MIPRPDNGRQRIGEQIRGICNTGNVLRVGLSSSEDLDWNFVIVLS